MGKQTLLFHPGSKLHSLVHFKNVILYLTGSRVKIYSTFRA